MRASLIVLILFFLAVRVSVAEDEVKTAPDWSMVKVQHERRLAFINDGEWVFLNKDKKNPLAAIFKASDIMSEGAIILVHDQGAHADQTGIIHELRTKMPDYGWSTLSLSIPSHVNAQPIMDSTADSDGDTGSAGQQADESQGQSNDDDASLSVSPSGDSIGQHISAAVSFLKQKKLKPIVLLGQGHSVLAVGEYLVAHQNECDCTGFILLNAVVDKESDKALFESLEPLRVKVIDFYGDAALSSAVSSSRRRKKRIKLLSKQKIYYYRQYEILHANQDFSHQEDQVIKRLRIWLKQINF